MTRPDLRPGDLVSFPFGTRVVRARVIEDRGHLGVGGRQLVRVEVLDAPESETPLRFEIPAEEVDLVPTRAAA